MNNLKMHLYNITKEIHKKSLNILSDFKINKNFIFRKIIFIIFIYLIQTSSYGMYQQETGEEDYQSSSLVKKTHVLFLCTGNSCRSQMAEGWTRHLGSDVAEVNSAGIKAHGLNHNAIKVMQEVEVDITNQSSKVVTPDIIQWADLVVTVCGDADESCPPLPVKMKKIHWPIEDPAKAMGEEEDIIKKFQVVRDEIHERIIGMITEFREKI
jgi:arsenate reductase